MRDKYYARALGDQNLPEEENLSDLQFQTVFPFGWDASAHVPKLM